jgi:hypothetical protein
MNPYLSSHIIWKIYEYGVKRILMPLRSILPWAPISLWWHGLQTLITQKATLKGFKFLVGSPMLVWSKSKGHTKRRPRKSRLGIGHEANNLTSLNKVLWNLTIDERWWEWACKVAQSSWRMIEPRSKYILQHTKWCGVLLSAWQIIDWWTFQPTMNPDQYVSNILNHFRTSKCSKTYLHARRYAWRQKGVNSSSCHKIFSCHFQCENSV